MILAPTRSRVCGDYRLFDFGFGFDVFGFGFGFDFLWGLGGEAGTGRV